MTASTIAVPLAPTARGTAPAGLTEPQLLVWNRLEAMRADISTLTPLDPDWLSMERRAAQHARLTGED